MAQVIIYSTKSCGFCHLAMDYFKQKGVNYTEIDVTTDPIKQQEMIQKSGQMGVPVIDIDGQIIVGFNKPRIDELLGQLSTNLA